MHSAVYIVAEPLILSLSLSLSCFPHIVLTRYAANLLQQGRAAAELCAVNRRRSRRRQPSDTPFCQFFLMRSSAAAARLAFGFAYALVLFLTRGG